MTPRQEAIKLTNIAMGKYKTSKLKSIQITYWLVVSYLYEKLSIKNDIKKIIHYTKVKEQLEKNYQKEYKKLL